MASQPNIKVFIKGDMDNALRTQIKQVMNSPVFQDKQVRLMPDCHPGVGVVVGFTAELDKKMIVPSVIGVDIGCGVTAFKLGALLLKDGDFAESR